MIQILSSLMMALALVVASPEAQQAYDEFDDWEITSDKTVDGVRKVHAIPSSAVCSQGIDLEIAVKGHVIRKVKFFRGCPGNTLGVATLLEGMTVENAIKKLEGIPCSGRATSCPDQLARVMKALKW